MWGLIWDRKEKSEHFFFYANREAYPEKRNKNYILITLGKENPELSSQIILASSEGG